MVISFSVIGSLTFEMMTPMMCHAVKFMAWLLTLSFQTELILASSFLSFSHALWYYQPSAILAVYVTLLLLLLSWRFQLREILFPRIFSLLPVPSPAGFPFLLQFADDHYNNKAPYLLFIINMMHSLHFSFILSWWQTYLVEVITFF